MLKYPQINTKSGRRSPSGRTLWCGPFATAVLTGLEYDEAYKKLLSKIRRDIAKKKRARGWGEAEIKRALPKSVQGVHETDLEKVLTSLKVKTNFVYCNRKREQHTLLTFTREHTVKGRTYLVVAGNHYEVVKDGILYHSHHDPLPIGDAPRYRLAKVTAWAEVKPRPEAVLA